MPNITQQIPNFLGGVSTQPDDQKLVNQVTDIINGYPDPTFGLIKRPGFNWIANLGSAATYAAGHWFYYRYSSTEAYVGVIKSQTVKLWNTDGTAATITNGTSQAYLNNGHNHFHVISRQDQIIITNKMMTAAMSSSNTSGSIAGTVSSLATLPAAGSNNNAIYKVSNTAATGAVASWDAAKNIKLQAREYASGNANDKVHSTTYWDGGSSAQISKPVLQITAIR